MARAAVFLAAAVPGISHPETCAAPNVARVAIDMRPAETILAVKRPIVWHLACPTEGPCRYVVEMAPAPPPIVICLTPEQNAEAEERGTR